MSSTGSWSKEPSRIRLIRLLRRLLLACSLVEHLRGRWCATHLGRGGLRKSWGGLMVSAVGTMDLSARIAGTLKLRRQLFTYPNPPSRQGLEFASVASPALTRRTSQWVGDPAQYRRVSFV